VAEAPWTIRLDEASATEKSLVGAKAANVALLRRRGFHVPPGFCVTFEAFRRTQGTMTEEVACAVARAWEALGSDVAVAVRSSANLEDLAGASAAGVFETFLNVRGPDAVVEAVARCWDSARSERAAAYLGTRGLGTDDVAMGVLVQEMAPAEVAGVAFTANPVTGNPAEVVVSAGFGLGEAVVDGESCDTFVVDRVTGEVREARVCRKAACVVAVPGGGTRREQVAAEEQERPALAAEELQRLVALSARLADELGAPQDIEWALAAGRFVLLQARPIPRLPRHFPVSWEPGERRFRWGLAYRVPFSPFGLSWERHKCPAACAGISDALGQPYRLHQKEVNGFLYVHKEAPPASRWRALRSAARQARRGRWFAKRWRGHVLPEFRRALAAELEAPAEPTSVSEQAARYCRVAALLPPLYHDTVQVNKLMYFHTRLLERVCLRAVPHRPSLAPALLLGSQSITTARDSRLAELARRARESALLADLATDADEAAIAERLAVSEQGRALLDELRQAADQWGYIFSGSYPEDPSWSVGVGEVVAYLRRLAEDPVEPGAAGSGEPEEAGEAAAREVRAALAARWLDRLLPVRRWLFEWVLRRAREYYPLKEDHNNIFYEATLGVRRAAMDLGRALAGEGALERPEDVFLLRHEELAALDGLDPARVRAVCAVVGERAAELARSRLLTPPETLEAEGEEAPAHEAGAELVGQPGSPGVAEGAVRIVRSPADFGRLRPGEILVCKGFRPYWTPLLLVASGLVTEQGSVLSHGANIAREYGVPAVIGVGRATQTLREGEHVRVEGDRGRVYRRPST